MYEEPEPQPVEPHPNRVFRSQFTVGAVFVVLLLLSVWTWHNRARVKELEALQAQRGVANDEAMRIELDRSDRLREEERAWQLAALKEADLQLKQVGDKLDQLERALESLTSEMTALLTSEEGRLIAAQEEQLRKFQALRSRKLPKPSVLASWRELLATYASPVRDGLAAEVTPLPPTAAWYSQLEEFEEKIASELDTVERNTRLLSALKTEAKEQGEKSESTLETALAKLQAQLDAQELTAIEQAVAEVRKEGVEQLAKEQVQAQRTINEAAAEKKRQEGEMAAQKIKDEAETLARAEAERRAKLAKEREKAELERKFAAVLPEIQELLVPFITDGHTQPKGREFRRTTSKGKVSLAALRGSGMLDDDIDSVRRLFNGMVPNRLNDRQLGAFPGMEAKGDWLSRVARAQQLLREYGELMVEKGMLSP